MADAAGPLAKDQYPTVYLARSAGRESERRPSLSLEGD